MKVLLARPRGFCAGVVRAIDIVSRSLDLFGPPLYVRHDVVHNQFVVNSLRDKGVVFVDDLDAVPDNSVVVFSAHGVAASVRKEAQRRKLQVLDATCPLVTKVHIEVIRAIKKGSEVILIGHANHPEIIGTLGQIDSSSNAIYLVETVDDARTLQVNDPDNLFLTTQTTLSVDDAAKITIMLKSRFPNITAPRKDDICYATQNRQDAVKQLLESCDLVLILGSKNSSNSSRLCEVATKHGVEAYLIETADALDPVWLENKQCVGISAGASAPEILVENLLSTLRHLGATVINEQDGVNENVFFSLPKLLR